MQNRDLAFNLGPGGSCGRSSGRFSKWTGNRCLPAISLAFVAILTSSARARDHGGGGGQSHQQSFHWHDHDHYYYRDPFWGSWYPGYSGGYNSDYWYTPTPEQRAAAEKKVQAYFAAVEKGRRRPASHRYVAVQTLRPTKKQLQDYVNKRAAARSAAANGGTQLSDRWVEPAQLRCMMVFDTQSKQFVGSGCYVVASMPPVGTASKFETFTAEFVGG
jgi:hypothetical protein